MRNQPAQLISIVIVNYNTRQLLHQCLTSVRQHCADAQVIVVDNASRDDSATMVRESFPEMQLLEMPRNVGFAPANNAGLGLVQGKYVILLNSDTVLENDALQRCAAWLETHPDVGATSPELIGGDGQPQQCLYPMPSLRRLLREALRLGPEANGPEWLAGTCLVLRASALKQVGGLLDGECFMYWEDADLSARLLRQGWKIVPCPGARIVHHGGASGGGPDATRRPDLHAWFIYGKHRWFARNRPLWEAMAVWILDACDVARKFLRGVVHPERRSEWLHARAMASVLARRLVCLKPPLP